MHHVLLFSSILSLVFSNIVLFPQHDMIKAVEGLVERRFGAQYLEQMRFKRLNSSSSLDRWEIRMDKSLVFAGTSATAITSSIQWYMKHFLHVHFDWYHEKLQENLPSILPSIGSIPIQKERTSRYSYYQNVCTVSYSMWSWDWETWEAHIDWMALNGINMPLAFTGQEKVWQTTFQNHFNITQDGLDRFFGGAAFLAWSRMGNLRGNWGHRGPLPQTFIDSQYRLQQRILARMKLFGMIPAMPSFAGFVPQEFQQRYPTAKIKRASNWGSFSDINCCVYYIEPTDPLFHEISLAFHHELKRIYPNASSLYQCDTYNEINPESFAPEYLVASSKAVIRGIRQSDPNGVWLMQGWLFQSPAWTNSRIQSYLSGVPDSQMIILDLYSEVNPIWKRSMNYFGKSWIYCVLHNFGGNDGLRGDLATIATDPLLALIQSNGTMIGIGLTMEGIYQNYPVYDLTLAMNWEQHPVVLSDWISQYITYRYGQFDPHAFSGWKLLLSSVYNCTRAYGGVTKSILTLRPRWKLVRDGFMPTTIAYNRFDLMHALKHLLASQHGRTSVAFQHDVVDVTRQVLSDHALVTYSELESMYHSETTDASVVCAKAQVLRDILDDADRLLSTHRHFLLGPWLLRARELTDKNGSLTRYFEYQARNQITRWGEENHHSIGDYASKQWAGLMRDYYRPRWNVFLTAVCNSKRSDLPIDFAILLDQYEKMEQHWNMINNNYTTTSQGDSLDVAFELYHKYHGAVVYQIPAAAADKM